MILQRRLSGPKSFEMEDLSGGGNRGPNLKGKRRRSPNAPPKSAAAVLDDDRRRQSASRDGILSHDFQNSFFSFNTQTRMIRPSN